MMVSFRVVSAVVYVTIFYFETTLCWPNKHLSRTTRNLQPLNNMELVDAGELDRQIAKAQTLEQFLQALFPKRDPIELWEELVKSQLQFQIEPNKTVEGISSSRFEIANGRKENVDQIAQEALEEISAIVKKSQCEQPADTLVDLYDEFSLVRGFEGAYLWPACMLAPRCSSSFGCCQDHEQCSGIDEKKNNVTLLLTMVSIGQDILIERRNVSIDTQCECQPKIPVCSPPDGGCNEMAFWNSSSCLCQCSPPCPEPFETVPYEQYSADSCKCFCSMTNGPCKKIKRGKKELPEKDCSCVRSQKCAMPECKKGLFFDTDADMCLCT